MMFQRWVPRKSNKGRIPECVLEELQVECRHLQTLNNTYPFVHYGNTSKDGWFIHDLNRLIDHFFEHCVITSSA